MLTYADGTELLSGDALLLETRKARLERAENAWKALPDPWARKEWHTAYVEYWTAMVQCEQAEAVPCWECDGEGMFWRKRCHHSGICPCSEDEVPCEDCQDTPGFMPCTDCGEHPATVLDEHGDVICAKCARED